MRSNPRTSTLRPPQLRLLPDQSVAMPSALDVAELEPQSARALWVRSVIPGLALFAAVFVARVLMFEGAAPAVPAASSAVHIAPPRTETAEPAAAAVPAAAPEAPATHAQPPAVPTRGSSARRAQPTAASESADAEPSRSQRRSRERPSSADRAATEGAASERTTRDERPDPSAEPEPASVAPAHARARDVAAPAATGSGMLRINSRPWSKVFVDGTLVGTTPQMALTLRPGQHTIELVNDELDMRKTILVDIEPDQMLTKVVNLIE